MSGPKVVRVVTREERIAICSALVAQLDAALASLKKQCSRFSDEAGAAIVASCEQRRATMVQLVDENNFNQAETLARQEIAYVQATKDGVADRAAKAAAFARAQASRRRQAAASLLQELDRKAPGQHANLVASLKQVTSDSKPVDSVDALLSRAMIALTPESTPTQASDAQRALAKSLQVPDNGATALRTGWASPPVQDKRLAALQLKLSQLDVLDAASASAFSERMLHLELERENATRNMKIDGLVLDISSRVDEVRRQEQALDSARSLAAQVGVWTQSTVLAAIAAALSNAIEQHDFAQLSSLVGKATAALEEASQQAAATARREAILAGLASLGYQVNDSMSTSWVRDGRVVLKKSDRDQHGIELASAADAQRLQVRAVAFSATSSAASDLAAETSWCGDFGRLQQHLKEHSGELSIERALAVGEVPLKVVHPPVVSTEAGAPAVAAPEVRRLC